MVLGCSGLMVVVLVNECDDDDDDDWVCALRVGCAGAGSLGECVRVHVIVGMLE